MHICDVRGGSADHPGTGRGAGGRGGEDEFSVAVMTLGCRYRKR